MKNSIQIKIGKDLFKTLLQGLSPEIYETISGEIEDWVSVTIELTEAQVELLGTLYKGFGLLAREDFYERMEVEGFPFPS